MQTRPPVGVGDTQGDEPEPPPPPIENEVTVTNDCPPDVAPAAAPAEVVQARPAFTG